MSSENYVEELRDKLFDGRLSKQLEKIPIHRPDVLAIAVRMFTLMNRANNPPNDLSEMLGQILRTLLGRILPCAWEGRMPPIRVPGRHVSIDKYIKLNRWSSEGPKPMMDI